MRRLPLAVSLALVLSACEAPPPPPPSTADTTLAPADSALAAADTAAAGLAALTEAEKLALIERLPLGLSYAAVRSRFPEVGPQRAEVGGAGALTEAEAPLTVFSRAGVLNLNFQNDALYSYYFALDSLACDSAEVLYDRLQAFYDGPFGAGREEAVDEQPGYRQRTRYWTADTLEVTATLGMQGAACRLAWGYQQPVRP